MGACTSTPRPSGKVVMGSSNKDAKSKAKSLTMFSEAKQDPVLLARECFQNPIASPRSRKLGTTSIGTCTSTPRPSGKAFFDLMGSSNKDPRSRANALAMFREAKEDPVLLKELLAYRNFFTTLMQACGQGNVPLVRAMIEAGADVNAHTEEGERVLNWCSLGFAEKSAEEMEIIKMLAEAGARYGPGFGYHPELIAPYC